jgi:hypothetical protein
MDSGVIRSMISTVDTNLPLSVRGAEVAKSLQGEGIHKDDIRVSLNVLKGVVGILKTISEGEVTHKTSLVDCDAISLCLHLCRLKTQHLLEGIEQNLNEIKCGVLSTLHNIASAGTKSGAGKPNSYMQKFEQEGSSIILSNFLAVGGNKLQR